MAHESDSDTNCNRRARYSHQRFVTGTGGLGNKRRRGDHPNFSIVDIGQNIRKSPGDLMRFIVNQTPVENADVKNFQISKIMIIIEEPAE